MHQKNNRAKPGERFLAGKEKWPAYKLQDQLAQQEGQHVEKNVLQEDARQESAGSEGVSQWEDAQWEMRESEERLEREDENQRLKGRDARFLQDLELRLSAYYGPALPAQPLPEAAWLRLRERLHGTEQPRCGCWRARLPEPLARRVHVLDHLARRARLPVPFEIQQMYATLLLQANYRRPSPVLSVQSSRRPVQPRVSAGVLGRGRIHLVLPRGDWQALRKAELDMLLAAGLARCSGAARPLALLLRALFALSLLFVLVVLPFISSDRRAAWLFLIAVACCLVSGRVLVWQQRILAFRGDRQAVQWLGRERVCRGLHLLAERGQPARRPGWGEPSLAERIARVCGAPLIQNNKRLTLVG